MSSNERFFEESREHSRIKSNIVVEYFQAWANVIVSQVAQYPEKEQRACYLELFAGPGRYDDGTESTPLRVAREASENPKFAPYIECIFNDAAPERAQRLEREIAGIPNLAALKIRPSVSRHEIMGRIPVDLKARLTVPHLAFIDPFGYKGLTSELIAGLVKNWGCDCLFFFNYNRINAAISNPTVDGHMQQLFGAEQLEELRVKTDGAPPHVRTECIMMTLRASLRSRLSAPLYMREFHFVDEQANRTSHYVVGVTKHIVGLTIMKDIMGKYSSRHENGVASFSREPRVPRQQELLLEDPLDDLKTDLMRRYAGRRLTFAVLIREHFPGTKFDVRHYKLVLGQLAAAGQVQLSGTSTRGAITEKTALHFGP